MGRKPNAVKLLAESSMPKNSLSLRKSERSPALEDEKGKSELEQKSGSRRKRRSGYYSPPPRRSQRKTPIPATSNHDIETYVEGIIVSENENDNITDTHMEKLRSEPDANLTEPCLKEKVDYILQRLEALEKIVESLQAKVDENIGSNKIPSSASAAHRAFTGSQIKLEALREENWQLTVKLETALGKLEVMEKQCDVLVELLGEWKDVIVISSLSKNAEAAVKASAQAIENACESYGGGKRKRRT